MTEKTRTFTKNQVADLLKKQVDACANAIDGDNLSQCNARKKIRESQIKID